MNLETLLSVPILLFTVSHFIFLFPAFALSIANGCIRVAVLLFTPNALQS